MPVPTALTVVDMSNLLLGYLAVLGSWRIRGYGNVPTHVVSVGLAIAFTWFETRTDGSGSARSTNYYWYWCSSI